MAHDLSYQLHGLGLVSARALYPGRPMDARQLLTLVEAKPAAFLNAVLSTGGVDLWYECTHGVDPCARSRV